MNTQVNVHPFEEIKLFLLLGVTVACVISVLVSDGFLINFVFKGEQTTIYVVGLDLFGVMILLIPNLKYKDMHLTVASFLHFMTTMMLLSFNAQENVTNSLIFKAIAMSIYTLTLFSILFNGFLNKIRDKHPYYLIDLNNHQENCSICLEMLGGKCMILTKCSHIFHYDCMFVWMQQHNTCPLCRTVTHEMHENSHEVINDV